MNKHLFVIFLSILSLNLCASDQMYFDYPGQIALAESVSPQNRTDNVSHYCEFPSSNNTPPPSNGSSPELTRRVDEMTKAIVALTVAEPKK
jgi:hypothetical protein